MVHLKTKDVLILLMCTNDNKHYADRLTKKSAGTDN